MKKLLRFTRARAKCVCVRNGEAENSADPPTPPPLTSTCLAHPRAPPPGSACFASPPALSQYRVPFISQMGVASVVMKEVASEVLKEKASAAIKAAGDAGPIEKLQALLTKVQRG